MKRILIVGNQGYLGSRLTDYLQQHGYSCSGADIGFFKDGLLFPPQPVPMLGKEARTIDESDIEGFDVVLQLAVISNDPFGNLSAEQIYDPTRVYAIGIAGICKKLGVKYIFPSSCSVYGIGTGLMDEDGVINPQTQYSRNKVQIAQDLAAISDTTFSPIALRLATVFGASPRIRFDVVVNMLGGMAVAENRVVLNSDGQAWRPHVYIEDVCEAFRCCIEWDYHGGKLMVLNVGGNDNNRLAFRSVGILPDGAAQCACGRRSGKGRDLGTKLRLLAVARRLRDACAARRRALLPDLRPLLLPDLVPHDGGRGGVVA